MKKRTLLQTFFLTLLIPFSINIAAQKKPNVVIIYKDDQGTIDLNSFGAKDLHTPYLDKIVNSGVKFTQFYGSPICSPSRASLLTGKTPQNAGVPGNVSPSSTNKKMV